MRLNEAEIDATGVTYHLAPKNVNANGANLFSKKKQTIHLRKLTMIWPRNVIESTGLKLGIENLVSTRPTEND